MTTPLDKMLAQRLQGLTLKRADIWAEKCRIMGKPFPGPYRIDPHFPWLRKMLTSDAQTVVIQKSAQAGVSEAMINRALYTLDQLRLNVFYALPSTNPGANDFSTDRLGRAITMSPYIGAMFTLSLIHI